MAEECNLCSWGYGGSSDSLHTARYQLSKPVSTHQLTLSNSDNRLSEIHLEIVSSQEWHAYMYSLYSDIAMLSLLFFFVNYYIKELQLLTILTIELYYQLYIISTTLKIVRLYPNYLSYILTILTIINSWLYEKSYKM